MSCESPAVVKRENETAELPHLSGAVGRASIPMGTLMGPVSRPPPKPFSQEESLGMKRGSVKMKGSFSLLFKAKRHAARPPDQRSDLLCAGGAPTFSSVRVLRQHQERMTACVSCHPSSSLMIPPPKKDSASSLLGLVQRIWGERHSGARHTPRRSFASLLECRWGAGAAWDGAVASLAGKKMHIWCYSLLCKLSKQLDASHVGWVEPNPLAPQLSPSSFLNLQKNLMLIHNNSIIV